MKALAGHHADVEQKFESMNQSWKSCVVWLNHSALCRKTWQILTHAITKNANDFVSLVWSKCDNGCSFSSADVRLASCQLTKRTRVMRTWITNEAVKLLEDLDNICPDTIGVWGEKCQIIILLPWQFVNAVCISGTRAELGLETIVREVIDNAYLKRNQWKRTKTRCALSCHGRRCEP